MEISKILLMRNNFLSFSVFWFLSLYFLNKNFQELVDLCKVTYLFIFHWSNLEIVKQCIFELVNIIMERIPCTDSTTERFNNQLIFFHIQLIAINQSTNQLFLAPQGWAAAADMKVKENINYFFMIWLIYFEPIR